MFAFDQRLSLLLGQCHCRLFVVGFAIDLVLGQCHYRLFVVGFAADLVLGQCHYRLIILVGFAAYLLLYQ